MSQLSLMFISLGSPYSLRMGFLPSMCWGFFFSGGLLLLERRRLGVSCTEVLPVFSRVSPGTPKDMGPPYGKRDPYHSHIFRDCYVSGMGIVWEAYHKGDNFLIVGF